MEKEKKRKETDEVVDLKEKTLEYLKERFKKIDELLDRICPFGRHYTEKRERQAKAKIEECHEKQDIINYLIKLVEQENDTPKGWIKYTGKPNFGLMCTDGKFKPLDEVINDDEFLLEGLDEDDELASILKKEMRILKELKEVNQEAYELDVKAGEEIAEQIAKGTF